MLDGLFDCNPLAIILFKIDDENEEHGEYMGSFSTWIPDELTEHLEHNFGEVTLVQQTETSIRYTYNYEQKGRTREGKILVTFDYLWDQKAERVDKLVPYWIVRGSSSMAQ